MIARHRPVAGLSLFLLILLAHASPSSAQSALQAFSNKLNPAFGVSVLALAAASDRDEATDAADALASGLFLQEVEIGISGAVDPYFRGQLTVAAHSPDSLELEEAYLLATGLPAGLGLRLGKGHLRFGKLNRLHTHALPLIDQAWPVALLLGEDGLNETSIELSYLPPLAWYSDLSVTIFQSRGHGAAFEAPDSTPVLLLDWTNLWDLTPSTTVELGLSHASGKTNVDAFDRLRAPFTPGEEEDAHAAAAEGSEPTGRLDLSDLALTFKHVSTRYRSWDVGLEAVLARGSAEGGAAPRLGAWTATARVQFARRWWGVLRLEELARLYDPGDEAPIEGQLTKGHYPRRASLGVAWVLSEFSALRLQVDRIDRQVEPVETRALLQLNATFGAHPAHSY